MNITKREKTVIPPAITTPVKLATQKLNNIRSNIWFSSWNMSKNSPEKENKNEYRIEVINHLIIFTSVPNSFVFFMKVEIEPDCNNVTAATKKPKLDPPIPIEKPITSL